jgi:hypothetical protein
VPVIDAEGAVRGAGRDVPPGRHDHQFLLGASSLRLGAATSPTWWTDGRVIYRQRRPDRRGFHPGCGTGGAGGSGGALRTRDAAGQDIVASFAPVPAHSWGWWRRACRMSSCAPVRLPPVSGLAPRLGPDPGGRGGHRCAADHAAD